MTADMVRTSWGWAPVFTPWAPLASAIVVVVPLSAIVSSLLLQRGKRTDRRLTALHLSVGLPLFATAVTDLVLPLRGIHVPPFGSAALVCWGAAVGWVAYRFREAGLSPGSFAREILETLETGVALLRVDGHIRAANVRLAELVGCAKSELLGRPIGELLSGTCVSEVGPQREVECELATASGEPIPVAISQVPLGDGAGSIIGYVVAVYDLREVAALRNRLVTSGRLAAVGQLAAGIAHEINNPLAYVRSNLGLLQSHWDGLEDRARKVAGGADDLEANEGSEMIVECREGVERIASIVRDVGGFARQGPPTLESADLSELLDTAVRVATPQLRHRASVERDYATPLPLVRCVPQELMQVFLNLVLNAAQAIDERGTIRLETRAQGSDVWVRIEDDGRGLPEGGVGRIFDPFFTTKPVGEGTGLGLAISRQIVVKHGGEIGAEARDAGGTVFWLRMPVGGPP
jgi:signal transduction histidine kinase